MALINCPECNREISDAAISCPHCGYPLKKIAEVEPTQKETELTPNEYEPTIEGAELTSEPVTVEEESPGFASASSKTEADASFAVIRTVALAGIAVLVIILVVFVSRQTGFNPLGLSGDDKTAYEMLVKASDNFKDPSSVRLVSGSLDGVCLYCGISATNSYGARETSYYCIYSSGLTSETSYPDDTYSDTESLDIKKINEKLAKELSLE